MSTLDLHKLTVVELRQQLGWRGLKKGGLKAELIERLCQAIESEEKENRPPITAPKKEMEKKDQSETNSLVSGMKLLKITEEHKVPEILPKDVNIIKENLIGAGTYAQGRCCDLFLLMTVYHSVSWDVQGPICRDQSSNYFQVRSLIHFRF